MIRRMDGCTELEERLAGAHCIPVEHHLFGAALARHAADQWMLAALAIAAEIGIGTVRIRDGGVVFLDPALHFRKQRLLQIPRAGERVFGMCVLGLEIGADRAIELGRVAHHRLPIRRPEPGVVVDERHAVAGRRHRAFFGARHRAGVGDGLERGRVHGRRTRYLSDDGAKSSAVPFMQ